MPLSSGQNERTCERERAAREQPARLRGSGPVGGETQSPRALPPPPPLRSPRRPLPPADCSACLLDALVDCCARVNLPSSPSAPRLIDESQPATSQRLLGVSPCPVGSFNPPRCVVFAPFCAPDCPVECCSSLAASHLTLCPVPVPVSPPRHSPWPTHLLGRSTQHSAAPVTCPRLSLS